MQTPIDYLRPNLPTGLKLVLALPGDGITPERVVCFRFDGRHGRYIQPNVWHEGVFALSGTRRG